MEVPPGHLAARRAGDPRPAPEPRCPQGAGVGPDALHSEPVFRVIREVSARTGNRLDPRLAHRPLPAARGPSTRHPNYDRYRWLGQPIELYHARRARGLGHVLFAYPEGPIGPRLRLAAGAGQYRRHPVL